jgi:hypothetical protein
MEGEATDRVLPVVQAVFDAYRRSPPEDVRWFLDRRLQRLGLAMSFHQLTATAEAISAGNLVEAQRVAGQASITEATSRNRQT